MNKNEKPKEKKFFLKNDKDSIKMITRFIGSDRLNLHKFYKQVTIKRVLTDYEIYLDKFKLRTPSGLPFVLPSEALALAVASEWEVQKDYIQKFTMPLVLFIQTQLVTMSLELAKQKTRHLLVDRILSFLETDSIWQ